MTDRAIELIDVCAGYGKIQVLDGVSLSVDTGTVLALLGPNGAGKSTVLKVASGHLRPTAGCVHVAGQHVNGMRPHRLARAGVFRVPSGEAFPEKFVEQRLRHEAPPTHRHNPGAFEASFLPAQLQRLKQKRFILIVPIQDNDRAKSHRCVTGNYILQIFGQHAAANANRSTNLRAASALRKRARAI